jgi:hypothetical protein
LPELAPPTGKGCRCLVASSRLAARNSLRQRLAALTILRARPQGYGR